MKKRLLGQSGIEITEIGLGVLILVSLGDLSRALIWLAAAWATVGGVGLLLLSMRQRRQYRDQLSEEVYTQL